MLSRAGTHTDRFKSKLKWTRPYKVLKTLSGNVYEVESLQGKKVTAHSTRLLWYEPDGCVPSAEVRKQFTLDTGLLEVQEFIDLRHENGVYELRTRWKGFTQVDDTWEPLEVIWEDVRQLVVKLFKNRGEDKFTKEALPHLGTGQEKARLTRFWDTYEDKVLIGATRKHGVGNYSAITSKNYLPGRSKQSLYFRVQHLLGEQSIFEYRLLRLDARDVANYNVQRYGVEFHKIVLRWESLAKRWFNLKRFGLKSSPEEENVPFHRKNTTFEEKMESMQYLRMAKARNEYRRLILLNSLDIDATIDQLEEEVAEQRRLDMRKAERRKRLEEILEEFRSLRISKLGRDEYTAKGDEGIKAKCIGLTWIYEVFDGDISLGTGVIPHLVYMLLMRMLQL
eukprot:maker-scaffold_8-snap-gene-5.6-mRNA-1 protein AED:0.93 eAED:1.00 QI:0/0/0/0.5/1/1/2/0/393